MTASLPFVIDRASSVRLADQIAHGIAGACSTGVFPPGQRLPGIREMAEALDVGEIVVRQAVKLLAEQGVVVSRRKTGIHVSDRQQRTWRAHVVLAYLSDAPYFVARNRALLDALDAANVRLSAIYLPGGPRPENLHRLRALLDGQRVDLVALDGFAASLADEIDRRRLPHLALGQPSASPLARGALILDQIQAWRELGAHLAAQGARSVAALPFNPEPPLSHQAAVLALAEAGLHPRLLAPSAPAGEGSIEVAERRGYADTRTLLAAMPVDAVVYLDDWVARGGILALAEAGRQYPRDLLLATHANRGFVPCAPCELTRVEADPGEHGAAAASLCLHVLGLGAEAPPATIGLRLVVGGSTRR